MKIGFIGLGTMGSPMAANLIRRGKFALTVWNRTAAKMEPLLKLGAKAGQSPQDVATQSDVVITMVSTPADVEQVVLREQGVIEGLAKGRVLIDMSTVGPHTSRNVAQAVQGRDAEFLDAPVSGSRPAAESGTLGIVVGGKREVFERCLPVLRAMGKEIVYMGPTGSGATAKLVINLLLAHMMAALSEGSTLARKFGLDFLQVLDMVAKGPMQSPWYLSKGPKVLAGNFETHFALKHMHKDLKLMLELSHQLEAPLPVTAMIEAAYQHAEGKGLGDVDYSAVITEWERMAELPQHAPRG